MTAQEARQKTNEALKEIEATKRKQIDLEIQIAAKEGQSYIYARNPVAKEDLNALREEGYTVENLKENGIGNFNRNGSIFLGIEDYKISW